MKEITLEAQKILDTLKTAAADTLKRKHNLGEDAVIWQDRKPISIGDDAPVHLRSLEVTHDYD